MKKLLVALAFAALTLSSYAQGYVNFNTYSVGIKVYDVDGTTPLAGTSYLAQLYATDDTTVTDKESSALTAKGYPVNFRSGVNAGYVQVSGTTSLGQAIATTSTAVTTKDNGTVVLQLRAWAVDTGYTTFDAAKLGGAKTGMSDLFTLQSGTAPSPTPNLTGLKSFSLVGVPEPTTIALGVMGAAALLFRRRK